LHAQTIKTETRTVYGNDRISQSVYENKEAEILPQPIKEMQLGWNRPDIRIGMD
jgi:hypothetical protein